MKSGSRKKKKFRKHARSILICDPICSKAYDDRSMEAGSLGGSEASVVRIGEALAANGLEVKVIQAKRAEADTRVSPNGVVYFGLDAFPGSFVDMAPEPDFIILFRRPEFLADLRKVYKRSKIFLFLTDFARIQSLHAASQVKQIGPTIVCLSDYHIDNIRSYYDQSVDLDSNKFVKIYLPVADELIPDPTPVDRDKLVFFSTPDKGLKEAIVLFQAARKLVPSLKLYVANPGYRPDADLGGQDGIVNLGALSHPEIIKHVRSALCVFYPNRVYPETFGLVFAEANSVGTPVLTFSIGSAREILCRNVEWTDPGAPTDIIKKLIEWRNGARPKVFARAEYRTSMVVKRWMKLLGVK